jgi:hypothetical protein
VPFTTQNVPFLNPPEPDDEPDLVIHAEGTVTNPTDDGGAASGTVTNPDEE